MRFVGLVFALALGSALASLAPELPDPVPALDRGFEQIRRRPFEGGGTTIWYVDPVQPSADSVYIDGAGYTEWKRFC